MNSTSQSTPRNTATRRQVIGATGAGGAAMLLAKVSGADRLLGSIGVAEEAQAQATSCVLIPSKTEGPYFVDEKLNRSDIRSDPSDGSVRPGTPVTLTMVIVRADSSCAPVAGAVVDIWHADAEGKYSDIASEGTAGKKFLRGLQTTDANGAVRFTTIFPGWYSGRAVHIHFMVRVFSGSSTTYHFTSQLFFDPATANTIYATSPYASRGTPNVANASDMIYGSDGSKLLVELSEDGSGGYEGTFVAGLSALPASTAAGASSANAVAAALSATKFRRTAANRRILRVTSTVAETVKVKARLSRNGTTIASRTVSGVTAGVRGLDLAIPRAVGGGAARLTLTYTDTAAKTKTVRKTVRIPQRQPS